MMMIISLFGKLGLLLRGVRRIPINCVCFHIPQSLRSRDILVMGRKHQKYVDKFLKALGVPMDGLPLVGC